MDNENNNKIINNYDLLIIMMLNSKPIIINYQLSIIHYPLSINYYEVLQIEQQNKLTFSTIEW
ncbi:hypothetical protein PCC7424_4721 [Gloeothece citriformis PCC 7424]|uniref:Uncharacterized protein n=1 Tax=Gloeothece citriformis (strain PCC 7424) TaxID=65393 RepID=B7KCW0_GLOC7|nr:hypothetical protein PCC7424_4721 [Gloeothece citriformis PCC 7424]